MIFFCFRRKCRRKCRLILATTYSIILFGLPRLPQFLRSSASNARISEVCRSETITNGRHADGVLSWLLRGPLSACWDSARCIELIHCHGPKKRGTRVPDQWVQIRHVCHDDQVLCQLST